jgi:hypothetical protein
VGSEQAIRQLLAVNSGATQDNAAIRKIAGVDADAAMTPEEQAVAVVRRLVRELGLAEALRAVPHLAHLVDAPTDIALETAERALAEETQITGAD